MCGASSRALETQPRAGPGLSAVTRQSDFSQSYALFNGNGPTDPSVKLGKKLLARDTVRGTVRVGRSARPPHARRAGAGAAWSGAAGAARRAARAATCVIRKSIYVVPARRIATATGSTAVRSN